MSQIVYDRPRRNVLRSGSGHGGVVGVNEKSREESGRGSRTIGRYVINEIQNR